MRVNVRALAEAADKADDREKLIEPSRLWMKVALREERLVLESRAAKPAA